MRKIRQFFSHNALDGWLLSKCADSPRAGQIFAAMATVAGYIAYALFPLMTLIGALTTASIVTSANSLWAWLHGFIWLLITATSGLICFTQLRVKISPPSGLGLKQDKAPRLYELLSELAENYQYPKLHRVVIHDKFNLELMQVPRFGLPFLTTNVLYVGLPILQGLSPAQFRGALARVLGQSSNAHNKKTHWIYRWHQFCIMYQGAMRKYPQGLYRPLQLFFRVYTPILTYWAADALRQDALEADVYALEIMNDEDLADVILRYEVCEAFLKNKYWPKIYAMLRKNPGSPEHLPHINMPKVIRNALSQNEFAQTMKDLINQEPKWRNVKPVLHERLNNIGQTKLDMPPPVMETAALRYLGDAQGAVIKLLDKQWQAKHSQARAPQQKKLSPSTEIDANPSSLSQASSPAAETTPQQHAPPVQDAQHPAVTTDESTTVTVADRKRLAALKHKAESSKLSDNEAWELAYLTEKLEDTSLAVSLYQQILKHNPNHARTLFAVGRIMLSRMDNSGVKVLERAMELDNGCVAQACWMLAKFYKTAGDDARSRHYLERAAKIAA